MRTFILAAALAVLGAAVVASPAFAFDHHFSVLGKGKSFHRAGQNAFYFKESSFHLNGKIGGFGDIRVRGDLDPGPDHLVVLGGSDDFDGVAGKVTVRTPKGPTRIHFDLVR